LSDTSADSSVIIVSDSDKSEDELESLESVERSVFSTKQQDHCITDQYATAVAAVFLNTTSKTGQLPSKGHDSCVTKLASTVNEDRGGDCSLLNENTSEIIVGDFNAATSSLPELVTFSGQQRSHELGPVPTTHTDPLLMSSGIATYEERKLAESIASELTCGLDSATYNELTDCLLSASNYDTFSDVCNGSFLGDLSFLDECLVKDCGSSLQLLTGEDNDVLSDIPIVEVTDQSNQLNEHGSDTIVSSSLCAVSIVEAASVANCNDQSKACFQQSVLSFSQSNSENSSLLVSECCRPVYEPANCVVTGNTVRCKSESVCPSFKLNTSQAADCLASDCLASETLQPANSPCPPLMLSSTEVQYKFMHLDVNANELVKLAGTDTIDSDEVKVCSSQMKVTSENDSCDILATQTGSTAGKLQSTGACKRLLLEEFSDVLCKRFRAEAESEFLCADWLTMFENVPGSCTTAAVSAASNALDNVNRSGDVQPESNADELLQKICCCSCNLPHVVSLLSYCSDGHACCMTCLQRQVKRLLSSASKACLLLLLLLHFKLI